MKLSTVIIAAMSLFLSACSNTQAQIEQQPLPLHTLQQQWELIAVDNTPIEINSSLNIDAQNQANGKLACNTFRGEVELQNNQLRINKMANTRKLCIPKINSIEVIVGSTLSNWSEVIISERQLTLSSEKHTLIYQQK